MNLGKECWKKTKTNVALKQMGKSFKSITSCWHFDLFLLTQAFVEPLMFVLTNSRKKKKQTNICICIFPFVVNVFSFSFAIIPFHIHIYLYMCVCEFASPAQGIIHSQYKYLQSDLFCVCYENTTKKSTGVLPNTKQNAGDVSC